MLTDQERLDRTEKAVILLKTLGNSGDEMAESLRKLGIKGKICRSSECPLGIFLAREGVSLYDIHDNNVFLGCWTSWYLVWRDTYRATSEFMDRFDRGQYLDLIDRDDEEEYDMH